DLVTRKLAANGGTAVWALLDELSGIVKEVETSNDPAFGTTGTKLRDALASLERASKWLLERTATAPNDALAGATPYLRLFGSTRRPMTGSAKQSIARHALMNGLLRRFRSSQ